jgi:hypothetical protein
MRAYWRCRCFKGLLTRWPATDKIPIEFTGGDMVKIKVRKGGYGGKKKRR